MAERFEIVEKTLLQMLESKKYTTLRDILITMNPSDVAGIFNDLEEKQVPPAAQGAGGGNLCGDGIRHPGAADPGLLRQ